MTHRGVQGEAHVNHPILKGTYLLHQLPVPMHLGSESPVFFINESCVDPRRPRVLAEQDEGVGVGVGFSFVGAESGCRVGSLLVHRIPFSHSPPHHWFVKHFVFDEVCGVEAALMAHFHRAEVGGYIVLKPSRASDDRGISRYAMYLRTARPPGSPLSPLNPASASPSSPSARRCFFAPGHNGSVCLDEGVLTWSLKVSQVMGGRLDECSLAQAPELSEDVGDVGDDEATWRGPQGLDVTFAVLGELATSFVSSAMSVTLLDSEGGVKPTRIALRSFTLHSAASLALLFISVRVSNQKHCRCASVFALAQRSCSSAHLLAVVFGTGTPDARSGRKVKRLGAVGGDPPWRGSGEDCPGFVELIVDEGREELAVSRSGCSGSH